MNNKLDRYFSGDMPATEKAELFLFLETDPEAKKEFVRTKNALAISELTDRKEDEEKTLKGIREFDKRLGKRTVRQFRINLLKYAAITLVLIISSWFASQKYNQYQQKDLYTEINVPKGQRVNMTLADGTSVWLSPRSRIKIPNEFRGYDRTVELDGEGYFSVTKDPKRPFIVKTQQFNVEVLGTEFNVFSYTELPRFETSLVEGSVLVYNRNNKNENIRLKPNEKVSVINDIMVKSSSDFDNRDYLKSGIYNFKSKPFVEILDCLSLWYNVKFKVTGTVALTRKISGKFRQSEEVEKILSALQGVYHFEFKKITDDEFEIY
ncbi:FecR domain-containing protein [Parabacteroides sp. GYB001]|uniref:FecR family protein n=1 Tax=Parabacteroides leei TaxID=2939491 RepID=UPI002017350F|nr:FecR family protein [Parabacteroides leei]MCL3853105.1 FecR domain-containing protein [Parabacteroides leei]